MMMMLPAMKDSRVIHDEEEVDSRSNDDMIWYDDDRIISEVTIM